MEKDPVDGKVAFVELVGSSIAAHSPESVRKAFEQLGDVAVALYEQNGYVQYPFIKIESG